MTTVTVPPGVWVPLAFEYGLERKELPPFDDGHAYAIAGPLRFGPWQGRIRVRAFNTGDGYVYVYEFGQTEGDPEPRLGSVRRVGLPSKAEAKIVEAWRGLSLVDVDGGVYQPGPW